MNKSVSQSVSQSINLLTSVKNRKINLDGSDAYNDERRRDIQHEKNRKV